MSVTMLLFDPALSSVQHAGPSVTLDDDPLYWFLYPYFESLHDQTGQMIDLYADAEFKRNDRNTLLALIKQAEDVVRRQPDQWLFCTGRRTDKDPGPVFQLLRRQDLLDLLSSLHDLTVAAISRGLEIHARGD